ncbi:MAG: hypothetical protein JKX82_00435 [Oleispira sp.]|nr:hypothetical protein [Oleispira sp.]
MKQLKLVQFIILMCGSYAFAQVGIGTTSPNASAQLEVVSNNRGILIPQLALTSTTDTSTITNGNIESLLVYNTNNTDGLITGYYYWSNSKWNRLATSENGTSITVDDNLTSTSTINALSAKQGKVLKDLVDLNTAKTGITTSQTNAISDNTAKTGITIAQAADIAANKTGITTNGTALSNKVDKITGKELSENDFSNALKTKLEASEITANKNTANGYVGLDTNSKIDVSHLPSITINNVYVVVNAAAQTALTPNSGDVVIRTDESKNYIYDGSSWQQLASPSVDVTSVNGKTGAVVINISDIATLQTSLDAKVDEVSGKELSENDFTNALKTKLDGLANTTVVNDLSTNSATDGLSANQGVVLKGLVDVNTAKTGITSTQANEITANTAKTGITNTQATDIADNKTGVAANTTTIGNKAAKSNVLELDNTTAFTPDEDYEPATKKYVDENSTNTAITDNLTSTSTTTALSANQGKVLKDLVDVNTAKTGITTAQASDITNNKTGVAANLTAISNKVDKITGKALSENDFTDALKTKLDGLANTTVVNDLTTGGTTNALSAEQGKELKSFVDLNSAKTGITTTQIADIAANKTGVTTNASAISDKVDKVTGKELSENDFTKTLKTKLDGLANTTVVNDLTTGGTSNALSAEQGKELKSFVDVNTAKTGITTTQISDIAANKTGVTTNGSAISDKVDKVTGKALSQNDFTNTLKTKLDGLANTTVVNDLTTGGTTNALSAEQGKALEDDKLDTTLADASIFIGNGSGKAVSQTISGDAAITNAGVLTIADDAVDGTDIKIASEAAGSVMYNDGAKWVNLPKGIAGQSLVMNTAATAPEWKSPININDKATSGYMDIGAMRMQWGTYIGGALSGNIVFPMPFASASYSFTGTVAAGYNNRIYNLQSGTKTATQIYFSKVYMVTNNPIIQGAPGEIFDWIAIGIKP